jgi:protein involved in polysaccharide export with SLBB domain
MGPVLIAISAWCLALWSPAAHAQPTTGPATTRAAVTIAAGDELNVLLGELVGEQSERVVAVDRQGKLKLPLLDAIHVAGMTVSEAETCIANAYITGRILAHPIVEITKRAPSSTQPTP